MNVIRSGRTQVMNVILSPSSATLAQFNLQLTVDSRHSGRPTRSACAVEHDLMVIPLNVDPPESAIIRAEGGGHTHLISIVLIFCIVCGHANTNTRKHSPATKHNEPGTNQDGRARY